MALKRGPFRVYCDEPGCDEHEDLETDDFEEAKSAIRDTEFHTYLITGHGFKHYCAAHEPYERRGR